MIRYEHDPCFSCPTLWESCPEKQSEDFMGCSLVLELQGSDLWEANNKSPSNFNRLGAAFGHVLISISLTTNMLLARLALYNSAAVSSATTCQQSQRSPFRTVSSQGWYTRKSRQLWRQQHATQGTHQITCSLVFRLFFFFDKEACQREALFLENIP